MLERLDRLISLRAVIAASPIVFLVHDLEEVIVTEGFLRENRERLGLPSFLTRRMEATTAQFAVAVAYLFVIVSAISLAAARSLRPGAAINLFATATSIRFLNVFTHLGQALLLRRATPGVVTAVTVALPYSLYALRRLRAENLVDRRSLRQAMIVGAVLGGPVVLSAQAVGRLATSRWRR